jgi:multidrug transporter EmrE-like cation transporter
MKFLSTWGLVILSAFLDSYAAFIIKGRFNQVGEIDFSSTKAFFKYMFEFIKNPWLFSALVTFVAAPAVWFVALNKLDITAAYPISIACHFFFIFFFGTFFLGEEINLMKIIGTVLIAVSFFFFTYKTKV